MWNTYCKGIFILIKNNSDIFEQNNVEDATKRNFAISAANKFRLALIDY